MIAPLANNPVLPLVRELGKIGRHCQQVLAKQKEDPRDGNQERNVSPADLTNYLMWSATLNKDDRSAQQRRHKRGKHLPKHTAQGQEAKKPYGPPQSRVSGVPL